VIPAHPVAGTEQSGPDAGFATLFRNRWCILTPPADADPALLARLAAFWKRWARASISWMPNITIWCSP
jgi:cyclohexadieny/prephenate dehydrogenase